jgi:hypothetical protein
VVIGVALAHTVGTMLNEITQENGKLYFGSATNNPELNDTKYGQCCSAGCSTNDVRLMINRYVKILGDRSQFGQIIPSNSTKACFEGTQDSKSPETD